MEPWLLELHRGDAEKAWDLFAERHRRLILATVRCLLTDRDDVMDVYSTVCESLTVWRSLPTTVTMPRRLPCRRFGDGRARLWPLTI